MKEVRSPDCVVIDPGDVAPPPWNAAAAAGAVRWCAQEGLPLLHRFLLVCLGLISDDDGLIGVVLNAELANATGAALDDVGMARAWLVRVVALLKFRGTTVLRFFASAKLSWPQRRPLN